MKASDGVTAVFDDPNLVSAAGLVPVLHLASGAGLEELLEQDLSVPSPNAVAKARSVIAGMLAGADSIEDAQVAQVAFTAFTSLPKSRQVSARLVVRRVKRIQARASDGCVQGELFEHWRHHAFVTNTTLTTVEADQRHRDHAIIEQVIAELKDGPLAHLPSGSYAANAAWVAFAVLAFNLARAASIAAGMKTARWASLRRRLITVPARLASSGRRLVLHLPTQWPWAPAWTAPWATITTTGPPGPATT